MFVRVIQHAHASVSSFKFIFVCLKCNKMHLKWLIKYFFSSFSLKDYFYLFSDVQNSVIIYWILGLFWFRHFEILPLENRRHMILKTSRWLIELWALSEALDWFKLRCTPPIWPYLDEQRGLSKKDTERIRLCTCHSWPVILVRFLWRRFTSLKLFIMLSVRTAFRSQACR